MKTLRPRAGGRWSRCTELNPDALERLQAGAWGALSERGRRPEGNPAPSKQSDGRHLRGNTAVWHIPNPNPPTFTVNTTATHPTPNRIAERELAGSKAYLRLISFPLTLGGLPGLAEAAARSHSNHPLSGPERSPMCSRVDPHSHHGERRS
ncbi:hypothetical protein EYF80_005443 [Liparis tanakae]|uniref:Uncharacterized protein n=1 Tax=Liparis tanakae TaxID=230148 RepID=A0A4Z2J2L9_9TELE|nr:hypothetical protein EYF80_005443 [Liparis tanakae]